jgi:hypothetical protein
VPDVELALVDAALVPESDFVAPDEDDSEDERESLR